MGIDNNRKQGTLPRVDMASEKEHHGAEVEATRFQSLILAFCEKQRELAELQDKALKEARKLVDEILVRYGPK